MSEIPEEEFEDLLDLDPNNFDDPRNIDNEWWPLKPGTPYIYEGYSIEDAEKALHRVVFTVTHLTRVINGVPTVVIFDRDYTRDEVAESELPFRPGQ